MASSLDRGVLERKEGGINRLGRILLGFVAIADGAVAVISLGFINTGWQLAFVRWCLMKR